MKIVNKLSAKAYRALMNSKLPDDVEVLSGSPLDLFFQSTSETMEDTSLIFSLSSLQTFIDTATGDFLTSLALMFGFERTEAVKAIGEVTFSRVDPAIQDWTIPVGTQVSTVPDATGGGIIFLTTEEVTLLTGNTDVTVAIEAQVAGQSGNVGIGTITHQVTPLPFAPNVTNVAETNGGDEEESDDDLRERVKSGTQENYGVSTEGGIKKIAFTLPNVKTAEVKVGDTYKRGDWDCDSVTNWSAVGDSAAPYINGASNLAWDKTGTTVTYAGIENTFTSEDWTGRSGRFYANFATSIGDETKISSLDIIITDGSSETITLRSPRVEFFAPPVQQYSFYLDRPIIPNDNFDKTDVESLEFRINTNLIADTLTEAQLDLIEIENKPNQINVYFTVSDQVGGIPTQTQIDDMDALLGSVDNKGITNDIKSFAPISIPVSVTADITVTVGSDFATIQGNVESALSDFINNLNVGQDVYLTKISQTIANVTGVETFNITAPVADTAIGETEKAIAGIMTITET